MGTVPFLKKLKASVQEEEITLCVSGNRLCKMPNEELWIIL